MAKISDRQRSRFVSDWRPTEREVVDRHEQLADPGDQAAASVYYLCDDNRRLLYVGITNNFGARVTAHAHDKPWFHEVSYAKFEHFATREAAEEREMVAIRVLEPRYNVMHNTVGRDCKVCGAKGAAKVRRRCWACYAYLRDNDVERPERLWAK